MFIQAYVSECDFTGVKYDRPTMGAHAIARGATGRWCAVMYAGPEYLAEGNYTTMTHDEAEAYIAENHPDDYLDF